MAVILYLVDDGEWNVLWILQGFSGWHLAILRSVPPLTECAHVGDRTCPIHGAGSVKWGISTCSTPVSKQRRYNWNHRYITWSSCHTQSTSKVWIANLWKCVNQSQFEKKWQNVPWSPLILVEICMPRFSRAPLRSCLSPTTRKWLYQRCKSYSGVFFHQEANRWH